MVLDAFVSFCTALFALLKAATVLSDFAGRCLSGFAGGGVCFAAFAAAINGCPGSRGGELALVAGDELGRATGAGLGAAIRVLCALGDCAPVRVDEAESPDEDARRHVHVKLSVRGNVVRARVEVCTRGCQMQIHTFSLLFRIGFAQITDP